MTDFQKLVKRMRDAQRVYFNNRSWDNLQTAKALEKKVDDLIAEQERRDRGFYQGKLF